MVSSYLILLNHFPLINEKNDSASVLRPAVSDCVPSRVPANSSSEAHSTGCPIRPIRRKLFRTGAFSCLDHCCRKWKTIALRPNANSAPGHSAGFHHEGNDGTTAVSHP